MGLSGDTPNGALAVHKTGNPTHAASMDPRVKAAVAFAPWGWNASFWDAAGLSGIKTPVFFVAGSVDSTSGYAPGVRNIYEDSVNAPRYLLTYENAGHNAGAPCPHPKASTISGLAISGGAAVSVFRFISRIFDH